MTEKQIYRRMNECYESEYGNCVEDEWYGDDEPHIWRFYRPSCKLYVKLELFESSKQIDIYEKQFEYAEYEKIGNYSW